MYYEGTPPSPSQSPFGLGEELGGEKGPIKRLPVSDVTPVQ